MMLSPLVPYVPPEVTLPKRLATEVQKLVTRHEALEPLTGDASSERIQQELDLRQAAYNLCGEIETAFMAAVQSATDECGRIEAETREQAAVLEMPAGLVNRELYSDLNFRLARDKNRQIRTLHQGLIEWRRKRDAELWTLPQMQKNATRRERFHAENGLSESRPPVSKANRSAPLFRPEDKKGAASKGTPQRYAEPSTHAPSGGLAARAVPHAVSSDDDDRPSGRATLVDQPTDTLAAD